MNPSVLPEPTLNLETVEQQFRSWRAERCRNEPIPDTLWQQVFGLLERYPRAQVLRTLGLKSARLTQKLTPSAPPSAPDFLAIPLTGFSPGAAESTCRIEMALTSGHKLTVQVPWPQLIAFIQQLLALR